MKSFKFGGVIYPIAAQTAGTPLLEVCDPALLALLKFLKASIIYYVGAALVGAANTKASPEITVAVGDIVPVDPLRIGRHTTYKFPILCGWRASARHNDRTVTWRQRKAKVRIAYVMPPLDADALVNLNPVLAAVEAVVDHELSQAFDPNYSSGTPVFTGSGIANAQLTDSARGQYQLADQMDFDAVVFDVDVSERAEPYSADEETHESTYVDIANATDPDDPVDKQVEVEDPLPD